MPYIPYGSAPDQGGDLYLPAGPAAPLICLFHGGFWRMPYGRDQLSPMAVDLAAAGYAVWNLSYRRVGAGGSPWPATLHDITAAMAHLPKVRAATPAITLDRLILLGHSAGGHLAFWAGMAVQRQAPALRPKAAIGLAPLLDLAEAADMAVGDGAVSAFLGGGPSEVPDRYRAASPAALLPLRVPQHILHGTADEEVPPGLSESYVRRAQAAGDDVTYLPLAGVDHMALIDPTSAAYAAVRRCIAAAA